MSVAGKDKDEVDGGSVDESNPEQAIASYKAVIDEGLRSVGTGKAVDKGQERAVLRLGTLYAQRGDAQAIRGLIVGLRPWFGAIPKVRTAKLVRHLIKSLDAIPSAKAVELEVVQEAIAWAEREGMSLLRQGLATQLASLYFENEKYAQALEALTKVLREVKRLDDKQLQVEIQLLESRVQHALHNTPKARAALTAARTAANAIYCPPLIQAQIDMQAGVLHAEEKDYKTAYSYFYECFEGYSLQEDATATRALKYMLLCKIMTNAIEDIAQILTNKLALRCAGRDIDAMRAIAGAYRERSLKTFAAVQRQYHAEIVDDPIVHDHLQELYGNLLEQNLLRIIEPFSCVEIAHVAQLIELPVQDVERKLSQMILDKRFEGVLDAAAGSLHIFDGKTEEATFAATLDTIVQMNKVVSSLFENCSALSN